MAEEKKIAKAEEKKPAKKTKKKNTNLIILIAVIVVAVVVAGLIFYLVMNEAPVEEKDEPGPVKTVTFSDLLGKTSENLETTTKATISMGMDITTIFESDEGDTETQMKASMDMEYDRVAKKMHMVMEMDMGPALGKQTGESYIMDSTLYTYTANPFTGEMIWVKQQLEGELWEAYDTELLADLLDVVEGEVLGEETVDGQETIKVLIEPDMEKLIELVMKTQEPSATAYSEAQIDMLMELLEDSLKELEVIVWISKSTSMPIRFEGSILLEMDMGDLYGVPGMGALVVEVEIEGDADFDSAVDIDLPADVASAGDVSELYSFENTCGDDFCYPIEENSENCPIDCYCGDGWCDETEDEASCVEDCAPVCGDGWCDDGEDCLEDCVCGNGMCDYNEDVTTCPEDCTEGLCVDLCGDEICQDVVCQGTGCPCAETAETCPIDCEG